VICDNCKYQIPDDAKVCPICNERVINKYMNLNKEEPHKAVKKSAGKFVFPGLLIVALLAVFFVFAFPKIRDRVFKDSGVEGIGNQTSSSLTTVKGTETTEENTAGTATKDKDSEVATTEATVGTDATAGTATTTEPASTVATDTTTVATTVIPDSYEPATVVVGEKMPPFHFTDLYGTTVTLDQVLAEGKTVYINTFTSWCTYCKEEEPSMVTLANAYKDVVQFVFIDFGEGYDTTYNYHIENQLYAGLVGYVDDWALGGVTIEAVPQSYVLAKDGTVVESISGAQSYSQIEANIVEGITYQAVVN